MSLYSRNDNLCKVCGEYFEDERKECLRHSGTLEKLMATGVKKKKKDEKWTCCNSIRQYSFHCASGPHSRLTINGFASSLTYWSQIRLLLALKYEANNDLRYLPNELVDLFIWNLVKLNVSFLYA